MFKAISDYFLKSLLETEADIINRFRIRMVYQTIIAALCIITVILVIYIRMNYWLEIFRTLALFVAFVAGLFYLRAYRNVQVVAHGILVLGYINYLVNVFIFFQMIDSIITLLAIINIIFAFHVLGQRWGIIYFALQVIPALAIGVFTKLGIKYTDYVPRPPGDAETLITGVIISFVIVYLLHQYQEAFRVSRIRLEITLKELTEAKRLAEEMNRLKTNFLSNMSHEIRTPINGILGISQVVEMETKDPIILSYMELQKQSGKRLLNTITSILNLSRVEAEKHQLTLGIVDINKLVLENCHSLGDLAKGKGLLFEVNLSKDELLCLSDETMLYQVINNIVGNAIKFTEKGSVKIFTSVCSDRSENICVKVTDTGVGVSKEFLPKIFNPFEQESSGQGRGNEGTGLGLSISKKYIEFLGGEISVASEKNKGSTFEIIVPLHKTAI